jgi:hypothetical protein
MGRRLTGRESGGLTEAVRIVACVTKQVRVSAGGVCGPRYLVVGCPKCRRLRTQLPHGRCCLAFRQYRPYVAAAGGAVSAGTGCRYTGTQDGRRWRKGRAR